jgi:lysozyme family protein
MQNNFPKSLKFVLADEGGNDDDPNDHGGRTSRGITQREYNAWRLEQHLPIKDVWTASTADITTIYHDEYWDPWCDSFPPGTDYLYFDMAVNAGPHEAALMLQRALGVADDGRIGPITRQAVKVANARMLIESYTMKKRAFYVSLHQPKYIHGWLNRCDHVRTNALSMLQNGATK